MSFIILEMYKVIASINFFYWQTGVSISDAIGQGKCVWNSVEE